MERSTMLPVIWNKLFMTLMAAMVLTLGGLLLSAESVKAQDQQSCNCDESICSEQGFEITFLSHTINQLQGNSTWVYKVCNDENGTGACTPPKDLSHVDIVLPGLSQCLTEGQTVSIAQTGGNTAATLSCSVDDKDPSCPTLLCEPGSGDKFCTDGDNEGQTCQNHSDCPGATRACNSVPCQAPTDPPLKVAKCDVSGGNLDPGECVEITVTIAGEVPTLGVGLVDVVSKAGPECASDGICGPSCGCEEERDGCLTRTLGFYGTHPAITNLFNDGLTVCGKSINDPVKNAIDVLCQVPGKGGKGNQAKIQLERQLAAAKLNIAATAANGGTCGSDIATRIAECEALCGQSPEVISSSGCIEDLDTFNNSQDTVAVTPSPFNRPGPADPSLCKAAK